MPNMLDRCVKKVMAKGHDRSSAYAICTTSTGWKRKTSGGWTQKKEKGGTVAKKWIQKATASIKRNYKEGEIYDISDSEIKRLIFQGYKIEYV